jgi:NhaP-type Na+/H+ or K+/H+ antiporter
VESHLVWFVVAGLLFLSMALAGSAISRWPLTTAMLYLAVGVLLGPHVAGLLHVDVVTHASAVERVTELAVIVSLFTAGLKLASLSLIAGG